MTKKTKPFIDEEGILHYGKYLEKYFKLSNENIKKQAIINPKKTGIGRTENGIFFKEYLPKDICKALLKTGEYKWIRGDKYRDYRADVYHKCWEVNKYKPNFENIEHCGNVSDNPCYGRIRYKLEPKGYTEAVECPRCEAVYAIYNTYKPLKWMLWDSLLWFGNFFRWRIIHNIYKDAETFFFAKSKKGKTLLKGWQEVIKDGLVGELVFWRKHYFKPIMKNSNLTYIENKEGWIIYNPELYDEETVKEMFKANRYNVIWEYEDWVKTKNGIKILYDKDWERGSF